MRKGYVFLILLIISISLAGCKKETKDTNKTDDPKGTTATEISPTKAPGELGEVVELTPSPVTNIRSIAKSIPKEDYPIVDGSTATIPLSEAVYRFATGATEKEAASAIIHTKTTESYYRLMKQEADILIVYEPSEEVKEYMETEGIHLQIKPIGKDALVFMANASNPVASLTHEQLIDIYSGKITNWSQVGGEDKELRAFQRPVNSGSQTLMQKLVMGEVPMVDGPEVTRFDAMSGILKAMVDFTNEGNTLGYSVFYYAKNMYQLPELKFMKVNGVEPSLQTIYDNSYPYVNEFYAVIREDEPVDSSAHKLFDWLTEEEGQSLVRSMGYVPISLSITEQTHTEDEITDHLPADYRYVLRAETTSLYSELQLSTVTIYDEDWKVQKVFQNVYSTDGIGLLHKDTPLMINVAVMDDTGAYSLKAGIYDMGKDAFLLPADYGYISAIDKARGYYEVEQDGVKKLIDLKGKILVSDKSEGYNYTFSEIRGDYYWIRMYNDEGIERTMIYNSKFEFIRKLNEIDYMNCIYSDDGSILFSKEDFLKKYKTARKDADNFRIDSFNDDLIIIRCGSYYYILDNKWNIVNKHQITSLDDSTSYRALGKTYGVRIFYTDSGLIVDQFYDDKGNLIKDETGIPYNQYANYNYYSNEPVFYRYEQDRIKVYEYAEEKRTDLVFQEAEKYTINQITGNFTILNTIDYNNTRTKIFMNDKLLFDLPGYFTGRTIGEDKLLFESYGPDANLNYLLVNLQGEILYQSEYPEYINDIGNYYIQITRGNYTVVMDYDGNNIVKTIKQELKAD